MDMEGQGLGQGLGLGQGHDHSSAGGGGGGGGSLDAINEVNDCPHIYQYILFFILSINISYQFILSIHPINNLLTHRVNAPFPPPPLLLCLPPLLCLPSLLS